MATVHYHPSDCGYMIPGVAIRLGLFVQMLDDHGIAYWKLEQIRTQIRSCKLAVSSSKQYFVKEEWLGDSVHAWKEQTEVQRMCSHPTNRGSPTILGYL